MHAMLDNLPLIAAGEWIKLVIFAVFFIIWLFNNLKKVVAQGFELRSTQSVADHVQQRLDTRIFGERAAHMVDDLEKQDAQREAHRKQVFDHQLGRLADTSVAAEIPSQAAAGQAAAGAG